MKGFVLFDIDGVIRDVASSYRLAIQETVNHFAGWRPTLTNIDSLKSEGCWNNDWEASLELIRRSEIQVNSSFEIPTLKEVVKTFSDFYFGGDPQGDSSKWKGFIKNEILLVDPGFFEQLNNKGFKWGFVSGAEAESARFVLEKRLNLWKPPLIAMGEAPDKPNPKGLLNLSRKLLGAPLGAGAPPIAYVGDTVADIQTIKNARKEIPTQKFFSLGVAPPHLHGHANREKREIYEKNLQAAGADIILKSTSEILTLESNWKTKK